MQETPAQFLSREDPLKEGIATHSSILARRIPWTEEPAGLQSRGSQRVGDTTEWLSTAQELTQGCCVCFSPCRTGPRKLPQHGWHPGPNRAKNPTRWRGRAHVEDEPVGPLLLRRAAGKAGMGWQPGRPRSNESEKRSRKRAGDGAAPTLRQDPACQSRPHSKQVVPPTEHGHCSCSCAGLDPDLEPAQAHCPLTVPVSALSSAPTPPGSPRQLGSPPAPHGYPPTAPPPSRGSPSPSETMAVPWGPPPREPPPRVDSVSG